MQRVKVSVAIGISAAAIAAGLVFPEGFASAYQTPERPPIVGLAHVGLFVSDMAKADEFYGRISNHIIHTGFIVHDRDTEDKFYRDILGFRVMWYGGRQDNVVSWVDMRVPDGDDWLEYMLGNTNPTVQTRGVMNHLALGVTSIQAPYHEVLNRGYKASQPPKIGRDGKWQLNLYDPDLTRVEMMEFKPVETPCCSPMVTR